MILDSATSATIRTAAEKRHGETSSGGVVQRNRWLFESSWRVKLEGVREGEAVLDYRGAEKRLLTWRLQAVDEILVSRGTTGVLWLAEDAASPRDVGYTLAFVKNEALYVVNLVTAVDRRFVDKEEVFALLREFRTSLYCVASN